MLTSAPFQNFFCAASGWDLYIQKSSANAYWQIGSTLNLHLYLSSLAEGGSQVVYSPGTYAYNWQTGQNQPSTAIRAAGDFFPQYAGEPRPYEAVRDNAYDGQLVLAHDVVLAKQPNPLDLGCFSPSDPGVTQSPVSTWKTEYSYKQVSTPVWTGTALCARYSEGSDTGEGNAEEWCYRYGIGPVQITYLFDQEHGTVNLVLKTQQMNVGPWGNVPVCW